MPRSVVDLTYVELEHAAQEAWSGAAREALRAKLPIVGSRDGRRLRVYPDGTTEDLGPVQTPGAEAV